jgi:hypothetical protein
LQKITAETRRRSVFLSKTPRLCASVVKYFTIKHFPKMMHLFTEAFTFERLDHKIRTRATGTPLELAECLNTSERNIFRLISELRDMGLPIQYDKDRHSYYYTEPVEIRFSVKVSGKSLLKIQGGENNFDIFSRLPDFGSHGRDVCGTFQLV